MRVERCLDRMLLAVVVCALLAPAGAAAQDRVCERTVKANVVAIRQPIWLNRLGANIPDGMMYALARDVVDGSGRSCDAGIPGNPTQPSVTAACLATGARVHLRDDKRTRPLVLRANEGDCLADLLHQPALVVAGPGPAGSAAEGATPGLLSQRPPRSSTGRKDTAANLRQRLDAQAQGKLRQRLPLPQSPAPGLPRDEQATAGPTLIPPTTTAAGIHVQGLPWVNGEPTAPPPAPRPTAPTSAATPSSLVAPGQMDHLHAVRRARGELSPLQHGRRLEQPQRYGRRRRRHPGRPGCSARSTCSPPASAVKPFGKKWEAEWYRSQATEQDLCLASKDGVYNPARAAARGGLRTPCR